MNRNQTLTDLEQAFEQFNDVSGSLASSFEQLNETVSNFSHPNATQVQDPMAQHLRELVDAIPGAVIVLNAKGEVEDFNVAARDLIGEPLKNELWRNVVHRVFQPELDQGELRSADGRQFSISTRPLGYQPGQILLLSDVTQTRQLQRAAQQNLHLMTMGKMMASLAHQIRTPLSSSMLYLSQIVEGNLAPEKNLKFSSKALDRIKHIEKMINDMLVFAHGGQFNTCEFALEELLCELKDQLQPQLTQHQATFNLHGNSTHLYINGNKDALLGAIGNLCMNALDASDQKLSLDIYVELSRRGDLSIRVKDNASGMDENTLEHLFDPFFTTKIDGTGLGLAVVKSVIESHQGSMTVESVIGEGSCFYINLPCSQATITQLSKTSQEEVKK